MNGWSVSAGWAIVRERSLQIARTRIPKLAGRGFRSSGAQIATPKFSTGLNLLPADGCLSARPNQAMSATARDIKPT